MERQYEKGAGDGVMTKFIFDLDGTITKEETLPVIAKHFSMEEEIEKLTRQTVMGHVPFVESFIRRVFLLGKLPIDEIDALLGGVELHEPIVKFIRKNRAHCAIATGNLSCWVAKLVARIGCEAYCSEGKIENNRVVELMNIIKKETVVEKYRAAGHRVVFIGDGHNDVEAMRAADIAIASGLTHEPAQSVLSVADCLVRNEAELCSRLNQLLVNIVEPRKQDVLPK